MLVDRAKRAIDPEPAPSLVVDSDQSHVLSRWQAGQRVRPGRRGGDLERFRKVVARHLAEAQREGKPK